MPLRHASKRSSRLAIAALVALGCCTGVAMAQSTAPAPVNKVGTGGGPPGPYTPVRWNEDYGYLKDPAKRTDFFDPIKYIPLNDAGDYLSLGGSVRYRYENFNNLNFDAGPQDDWGYHLTRLMAHADLHLGPVRAFVQGISAMEDARDPEPRAGDADVHQAFVDLRLPLGEKDAVTFRGGRQNLAYGAQRVIGPGDWNNVRRTWDGGKAMLALGKHSVDLFVASQVLVEREELNNRDGDVVFSGIYDTLALPDLIAKANSKLELYGLILNANSRPARAAAVPAVGAIGVDSDVYTVGARFSTNPKPFDLDVEGAYQFGKFGDGDIDAWMFAVEGGYTFADVPLAPRVYLGFDIASGGDLTGDDRHTYNQLFPTGHAFFGYIDAIGRQNIIDLHPGLELALVNDAAFAKRVSLRTDYHLFWRQNENDAVYNASGAVLRGDLGSDETYIGSEVDLLLNWQIDRHWAAYAGYSHFFAGDFISDTGPDDDIDFFYAAVQLTF